MNEIPAWSRQDNSESANAQQPPVAPLASSLVDGEFHTVDPRSIQADMITSLIFSGVLSLLILAGCIVAFFYFGLVWQLFAILAAGLVLIFGMFCLAFLWPRIEFNRLKYRIDREGLEIRRGVVWRHQITIPLGRVQHADVSQGPIQRMFGIGTLMVHTAGTQNASVGLEGLEHQHAVAIRDFIVHQRKGQDAV
ncbi:MAG: PH domain-containing protein [Planctomycetota bacterium]